jgi:hypothetical protein
MKKVTLFSKEKPLLDSWFSSGPSARTLTGMIVLDERESIDLVWTEDGINFQARIPKKLIATIEPV